MVKIIDVTIRDGGFTNLWKFDKEFVKKTLQTSSDIGIDYFEIGYLMDQEHLKINEGQYRNISFEEIDQLVKQIKPKCKISVLIDYWRYNINQLLPASQTSIDLIRVTCYMDKVQEAIDYIKKVKQLGYKTSLNVMCGSYLTDEIIEIIKTNLKGKKNLLDYFYIADSFGSMTPKDVVNVFTKFQNISIPIGFHIHNNNEIGMANLIASLDYVDIIDASYNSLGRGAGNVSLQNVLMYLIIKESYPLNIKPLLNYLEYNEKTIHAFTGLLNVHPYRANMYQELSMYELYLKLKNLSTEEKIDYHKN